MEAAVRWSPLSTHDRSRFLLADVAGNALTLYQVESQKKCQIQYKQVAHREKVPNFTAFDWSRSDDTLVALGLSSGEASLIKIEPDRAPAEPLRSFTIKTQRKCNTITFGSNNLLAIGLDRVRHDHCLNVYDLNTNEAHSKLCVSEAVTSVRFFPTQPHELLAAVSRTTIRLYDLRGERYQSCPLAFAFSKSLWSLFHYMSPQYSCIILHCPLSGPSELNLSSAASATNTAGAGTFGATKLVNNIAIDPLDENYFASGGSTGDPSVTIWDKRRLSRSIGTPSLESGSNSAVLELRPATDDSQTTSVWSIRYSGSTRGRFCLLSSAGELKVYDTSHSDIRIASRPPPANIQGGNPWVSPHYVARTHNLRQPVHDSQQAGQDKSRVIAFDWMSSADSRGQSMLALHPDRKVDLIYAPNPYHLNMTGRDDMTLCREDVLICEPTLRHKSVADEVVAVRGSRNPDLPMALDSVGRSSSPGGADRTKHLDQQNLRALNGSVTTAAARTERWLDDDLGKASKIVRQDDFADSLALVAIQRRRCQEGYLFDCQRNTTIVSDNPDLVTLWSTIERLERLADGGGMISESLDLSFLGVSAVWEGKLGKSSNRVVTSRSFMPARFEDAVNGILERYGLPLFDGPDTGKPDQRQLCLAICGSVFSLEECKDTCEQLKDDQQYYRAVATAMFYGYKALALELLRDLIRGKVIQNIGLGALIASDKLNKDQREMCTWLEEDATDPYLQAMLVYLATSRWISVVNKPDLEIDLSDRLIIAFHHLEDNQINDLLDRTTSSLTALGSVEGILLTGLTEQAMDLFQSYIRRTNDLQTAVLATAFTNPLYVDDLRWEMWKETYFMQMQSWRAFIERTRFTMQHTRRCVTASGEKLVKAPPKQLTLRCAHCQGSMAHNNTDMASANGHGANKAGGGNTADATRTRITGPAANAGTVCQKCGRHLPRCCLCMQWLGTPDPKRAKDVDKEGASETDLLSKFVTFCASCTHGFHAHHARTWFAKHAMCPVPDCRCLCGLRG